MNGLRDFVMGGYPLPWMPVNMGDFVAGGFPLPQTPVFIPDSGGSLPKAPPMPRAAIAHGSAGPASPTLNSLSGISGIGCGSGCGCTVPGFGGMGSLCTTCSASMVSDTLIPQASLPTFLQGDAYIAGFPTVYLGGIVLLGVFMMMGGKKGRR